MNAGEKFASIADLVHRLDSILTMEQAETGSPFLYDSPKYAFLIGAGFSQSAGFPSTQLLASALMEFQKNFLLSSGVSLKWEELFHNALENIAQASSSDYYQLMNDVLPLPASRQRFVTAVVEWASFKQPQINKESILLGSILLASTNRGERFTNRINFDSRYYKRFSRIVFTTNFDDIIPTTFTLGNQICDVIENRFITNIQSNYPTICYLHGRHFHYNLRNTSDELYFKGDLASTYSIEPIELFFETLKACGLIVLGYSGEKEDCVMEAIQQSLASNGLPNGLYWAPFRDDINNLSHSVHSIVEKYPRAYYLTIGEPEIENTALNILTSIVRRIGLSESNIMKVWFTSIREVTDELQQNYSSFVEEVTSYDARVREALYPIDFQKCRSLADEWETTMSANAENIFDVMIKSKTYFGAGRVTLLCGRCCKAVSLFQEAERKLREIHAPQPKALVLLNLGHAYNNLCKIDLAYEKYLEAKELADKYNLLDVLIPVLKGIADYFIRLCNFSQARDTIKQAITNASSINAVWALAEANRGYGHLYYYQDQYDDARRQYDRSLILSKKIEDPLACGHAQAALAKVELAVGDIDTAVVWLDRARSSYTDREYAPGLADVQMIEAELSIAKDEYDKALSSVERGLKLLINWEHPCASLELQISKAKCLTLIGRLQEAQDLAAEIRRAATQLNHLLLIRKLDQALNKLG